MALGRKTGGRVKGSKNKIKSDAAILREMTTDRVRESVATARTTPLEYFLDVMHDAAKYDERKFEAAKAAAPYVHAKPVEKTDITNGQSSLQVVIGNPTDEQRIAALEALLNKGKTNSQ